MSWIGRIRNLFREEGLNAEFEEEMRFHVEERAAQLTRNGADPQEAHRQARRRFGNPLVQREAMRDAKVIGWMVDLHQDLWYALRMMARHPGFAVAAIASLSLAIGANCAVFSVLNALVLRPLPVRDPGSLVHLYVPLTIEGNNAKAEDDSFSYPLFLQMRNRTEGTAELFAASQVKQTEIGLPGGTETLQVRYQCISGNAFRVLGVGAAHGRLLQPEDDLHPGAHPVAVLSYQFWQRQFGKSHDVIGRKVFLEGQWFEILGVVKKGLTGIDVGTMPDIWIPQTMWQPTEGLVSPDWRNFRIMGRMHSGVTREQLEARMQAVYSEALREKVNRAFPDGSIPEQAKKYLSLQVAVRPAPAGPSKLRGQLLDALLLLTGVAGLVLLVACCNVGNLMLARAATRRNEIDMRVALGAGKGRILRQMLTESLLVGVLACCGGLLLALRFGPTVVGLLAESDNPLLVALDLDGRVLGFLLLSCFLTTLACGLAPALRVFRSVPDSELRRNREASSGVLAGRLLVFAQVAMSFVLVGASLLFALSLHNLLTLDAGFSRKDIVLAEVSRTAARDAGNQRAKAVWEELRLRLEEVPGVRSSAYSTWGLFSGNRRTAIFGRPGERSSGIETIIVAVSPNFFGTMGTQLLRGRDFLPLEDRGELQPVIINQAAARQIFSDADPVGRMLQMGLNEGGPKYRIIGLVGDAKYRSIREPAPPTVYMLEEGSNRPCWHVSPRASSSGSLRAIPSPSRWPEPF